MKKNGRHYKWNSAINKTMTDILIVGTGALATLFAARLTSAGHRITVLGTWPEGLRALRENGARLVDSNGHEQSFSVQVAGDSKTCQGAKYAIVLVKSWQTERAAHQLKDCLAQDGVAITLQNGLGNREILAEQLGLFQVMRGQDDSGSLFIQPGQETPQQMAQFDVDAGRGFVQNQ